MLFCHLLIFFKINFFKKFFQEYHQSVSNSLDPDQGQHFVGPDLGPNCLQRLLADDTRRQRFNWSLTVVRLMPFIGGYRYLYQMTSLISLNRFTTSDLHI